MAKVSVAYQLPYHSIRTLQVISDSLARSKNWIIENAISNFGFKVDRFLAVDEEFREYLKVKKSLWKQDLWGEQLRYHMKQGFILKNSIRKIIEMIQSGVNKDHILKVIALYEKIAVDSEYKGILIYMKDGLTGRAVIDVDKIRTKLMERKQEKVLL